MHDHPGLGMLALELQQLLERELLVHVAGAVPQHHVRASGEFADIGAQVAVGPEKDGDIGRDRLNYLQGVRRGAADIRKGLNLDRRIDIGDHAVAGILRLESGELCGRARVGERAASLGAGDEHLFFGTEHLGRLGHEVHAGKEDDVGIDRLCAYRQGQRVAQEVGHGLHFGSRVVVREDHGVLFTLETLDALLKFGGVFHNHFLFFIPF